MAKIDDGHDVQLLEPDHRQVGELPVEVVGTQECAVQRRTVTEEPNADLGEQVEVGAPMFVEAARLQLVDADAAPVDRWNAVLDAGREHEEWVDQKSLTD